MDIEVKTGKLREKAGEQKKVQNEVNQINNSIQTSRRKLKSCLSSSASGTIDKALNATYNRLRNISDGLGSMADGLDMIAGLYEAAEQDISGNKPSGDAVNEVENGAEEWTGIKWGKDVFGKLFESVLKVGSIGSMILSIRDIWNDDNLVDKFVDGLKLGKNVLAKKYEHMKKGTSWKKILLGDWSVGDRAKALKDFVKHPIKQIKSAIKDEIGEYSVKKSLIGKDGKKLTGDAAKGAKGKVFTKWFGGALTVIDKVVGNVKEHGGDVTKGSSWGEAVKKERFWKETATEAALEIGKDILIGAAVVAVIGSGGWVAALATAGVSIALDVGTNAIAKNNKGFTENVSDFLVDTDEKINNSIRGKGKGVFTKWFGGNASFATV